MKLFKSAEEKAAVEAARQRLRVAAAEFSSASPEEARVLAHSLAADPSITRLSDKERRSLQDLAFTTYAETVLADDHLTADEEGVLLEVADALAVPDGSISQTGKHRDIFVRLMVAKLNDARLDTVDSPRLIAKPGEIVHAETGAALMKEVAIREFRGGSSGVSFRIAKGVRYHVGGFKGRSVVVGSELTVQDTGALSVTSKRAVFLGEQKSLEFLYAKLLGLEVFDDGIRLQVSNRQTVSLLRVHPGLGPVMAATINAAMQPSL